MASPYSVGHTKYKRKDSDSLDSPSTSKQKFKRDKEDSLETNTCKTVQVTRHLRLRNNTGCCRNHNCQLEDLPCERNLCFSNVAINILDRVEPLKDFLASNVWKYSPHRQLDIVPILMELDFIFKTKKNQEASTGVLRKAVANVSHKEYLGNGEQQDAAEYLETIFELLHEEFIKLGVDNFLHNIFQSSEIIKKRFISSEGNGACQNCHTLVHSWAT